MASVLACLTLNIRRSAGQSIIEGLAEGTVEMEELEASEIELLEDLRAHPIRINAASKSRLAECGLFSAFQVASITDYLSRSGDILSYSELSALDGFSTNFVSAIKPFIDLSSKSPPGQSPRAHRSRVWLTVQGSGKKETDSSAEAGYGIKGGYELENVFAVNGGLRNGEWAASGTLYTRTHLDKLVVGDFNARFGQGLTMWSGFSMSGFSSCSSFSKKGTGISASKSYTGSYSLRGAAAQFGWGRTSLSCFGAISGLAGADVRWVGRKCSLGATGCLSKDYSRAGAYADISAGKCDFWTEAAYDFTSRLPAALAGMRWNIAYGKSLSLLMRWYPSNLTSGYSGAARASSKTSGEAGIAVGFSSSAFSITLDAAQLLTKGYSQIKSTAIWSHTFSESTVSRLRCALRYRHAEPLPLKTDVRADVLHDIGQWHVNARINYLRCKGNAGLAYVECGFTPGKLRLWMRMTGFWVDNWDDRIYSYERDAPGNFNVPAFYGKGISASLYAGFKFRRSSLYARASLTRYFITKPGKIDLRIQYSLKL